MESLGLDFVSLRDNLDLSTPSGRLMFQIIGAAQWQNSNVGTQRARNGGVPSLRPSRLVV
jgi:DNA invertase Pin-like site-specific DNA recombinase